MRKPEMSSYQNEEIEVWEGEGGATPFPSAPGPALMVGTVSQVEWSERIKSRVDAEFDRVAAAFRAAANRQKDQQRADTEAIIAILEDKRAQVMRSECAGYFIHDWQEIGDQVRQMIFKDERFQAIKRQRPARRA
jgi:hypothetical protein